MSLSVFLTAYFWLFLGYVMSVVVWVTVETAADSRSEYSDLDLVEKWLGPLLRRGYDGGYLRLRHEQSRQFMRFRKYIRGKGDYGLEIQCLGLDWLESAWQRAEVVAEDAGRPHRVELLKTSLGNKTGLIIDCGQDETVAFKIGKSIWAEVFGLSFETPYTAVWGGLSEVDELIDGPDHPPTLDSLPPSQRLKELDARMRRHGKPSLATVLLTAALTLVGLISAVGFPVAMLMSRGQGPDWHLHIGTISLGGSTASLTFLVVLVLSVWGVRRLRTAKTPKPKKPWEKRLLWLGRAITLALPSAVILAWAGH